MPVALRIHRRGGKIGEILLAGGHINEEQLKAAIALQKELGLPLGRIMVERGYVTESTIATALARQLGLRYLDLSKYQVNAEAITAFSEDIARRYLAVPVDFNGDALIVAVADPTNILALDDLSIMTGYQVEAAVATEEDIKRIIDSTWKGMGQSVADAIELASSETEDRGDDLDSLREVVDDPPIVKFVNLVISQAVKSRASDIHVEPGEKELRIRYRIDGVLQDVMTAPRKLQSGVISRLKIMSDMDIAERRVPLDGRCSVVMEGKAVDLRVASCPTVYGEEIVMRILDKGSVLMDLDDLGLGADILEGFKESFKRPHGAILVTGPTGSGKTTTLYATLNVLNDPDRKIITVEDPVEYRLSGINQIQTNAKAGMTFARGLRSILRLDPDVVMVGEIRDPETAKIAVEASLTGHLVLSTLHTNDAPGALNRLVEMGVEPFLIGSAVECVLAQRLTRLLCPECREEYEPTPELAKELKLGLNPGVTYYKPVGCDRCGGSGYRGRLGLYEVMHVTEEVERLIVERASTQEIKELALSQGMRTLRQDGMRKAEKGLTSLQEVVRVTM